MAISWKTVRVFISSTFRDMHAERDHLVRFVFPRLREELLPRRIHLVDVDLRWGVTSDQDAFDLCMDEIERCHPRFICILGGRYGWVPPPKTVAAAFMAQVLAGESPAGQLNDDKRAALTALYGLDPSANLYRLAEKPQTKTGVEIYKAQSELAAVVFQCMGLSRSITASEIHYGALDRLQKSVFRFFYFRNDAVTKSIPEPSAKDYREPQDSPPAHWLAELKTSISKSKGNTYQASEKEGQPPQEAELPLPWYEYPCDWDNNTFRITKLKDFGDRVCADLMRSIQDDPELWDWGVGEPPGKSKDSAEESAAMEAFIEERTERYFVGSRKPIFEKLRQHAEGAVGNGYLCLVGEPGSGKSALLAQFYRDITASPQPSIPNLQPSAFSLQPSIIIPHFVGASAGSTDVRRTLHRFCHELKAGAGLSEDVPEDFEKLLQAFPEFLKKAAAGHRVIILLDAINQFDPSYQSSAMVWLPDELPPNVRIILSALPCPALEALRKRGSGLDEVPLPALAESDTKAIIDGFLARYRKTLDSAQCTSLLAKKDAQTPLYLLAALEDLRTLGIYDEITDRIEHLPGETQPLFIEILKRLEADPGFRDAGQSIGPDLVRKLVSYISVSRHGLSYRELSEIIAPGDPKADPPITADAQGNVAALLRLLRPYLMKRGELLDFYHTQIREAAVSYYLAEEGARQNTHIRLADYFNADLLATRTVAELPWQLSHAGAWQRLYELMLDPAFFLLAWKANRYEVMEYWTRIQTHFPDRSMPERLALDAYMGREKRPDMPMALFIAYLLEVAKLFSMTGHEALALLFQHPRSKHLRRGADTVSLQDAIANEAVSLISSGDMDGAMTLLKEQEALCVQLGKQESLAICLENQATVLYARGKMEEALDLHKKVEQIFRQSGHREGLAVVLGNQAHILSNSGDTEGAMALHVEAERICREIGNKDGLAATLANQADILLSQRKATGAITLLKEAAGIFRDLGNRRALVKTLGLEAAALADQGDLNLVDACLHEQEQLLRGLGDRRGLAVSLRHHAAVFETRGDLDGALARLEQAEAISRESGDQRELAANLASSAKIHISRGDLAKAIMAAKEEERLRREIGDKGGLPVCLHLQACVFATWGDTGAAMDLHRKEESLCRESGNMEALARCLAGQAIIMANYMGKPEEAQLLSKEACRLARNCGHAALAEQIGKMFGSTPQKAT